MVYKIEVENFYKQKDSVRWMEREVIARKKEDAEIIMLQIPQLCSPKIVECAETTGQIELTPDLLIRMRFDGYSHKGFPILKTVGFDDTKMTN
jgi:hypothetical protein